jgi:hypothetical protein
MGLQGVVEGVEGSDLTTDGNFDATRTVKKGEERSLITIAAARNRWSILPDVGGVVGTAR